MGGHEVLLIFTLFKLGSFELSDLFDIVKLVLESLLGLVINVLDVCDILSTFLVRVIVNLERAITPQKRRVSTIMVFFGNDIPIQSITYQLSDRGGLRRRKVSLRSKDILLSLTYGAGMILPSDRAILGSVCGNGVAKSSVITVFEHLLETLRVRSVVDQGLELVRLYVLDSEFARFIEMLSLVFVGQIRELLRLGFQVDLRNF